MAGGSQHRTVVAAPTMKAAAEAVGIALHHFRGYWSTTENPAEVAAAMSKPGKVFRQRGVQFGGGEYKEI